LSKEPATIGERLFALREERGLSQTALQEASGVSRITIGKLEADEVARPRIGTLRRLARALDVAVEALTGESPAPKVPVLRLEEMLRAPGAARHAALQNSSKAERDSLIAEIDTAEDQAQREWATSTDPEDRAELWDLGRQLHSLRAEITMGPAAIPVRQRERSL
jgi:transcriptional regulator with XRE-family HTH domain